LVILVIHWTIESRIKERFKRYMATEPDRRYTVEEYLALESKSEVRHEYWNGQIFAMTGGSPEHNQINSNVSRSLGNQLEDRPCSVYISDQRVKVPATGLYTYPDIVVVCGEQRYETIDGVKTLLNPNLIVEVLSSTTEDYDKGRKFDHYRSIDSLKEYFLIAQDKPHVMLHVKQSDGKWLLSETNDIESTIHLPLIDCRLALKEIYRRVQFGKG
jgi:Uma2 family endonuclease